MSILASFTSPQPVHGSLPDSTSTPEKSTLLVVDDEEGPRQSIRIVFKEDYNVLMCDSGAKAIELAQTRKIDAAILDIRMSGMSGIEVLMRLKEIDPDMEVVMLTAYETLETARQALRLGACDYLNKPFDIATLRESVQTAMARRTLSNEIRTNNQRLKELQEEIHNQKLREELARTRGEIYASIIHDINGPLTIISGFIEVINQRIGNTRQIEGENLEMVKDRLTRITRQISNCIQICRRYLGLLRGRSVEDSTIGIKQVLTDMQDLLKPHPSLQLNRLRVHSLPEHLSARMNSTDLIQVLLNIILNAFQCSDSAVDVDVRVEALEHSLDVEKISAPESLLVSHQDFENKPPLLAISVEDNGPGIPQEIMPQIFDPYFTTKPSGQGTGLGLSIVRRLVLESKGALQVKSCKGKGAIFTVYLPAERLPSRPPGATQS
jgi:two-component system, sensor histidine kinase and response regulator